MRRTASKSVGGLILAGIWVYRRLLSPWLPPCCRFQPTCSAYAALAVRRHGPLTGSLLSVWRLLRCHPLYRGPVVDPVPPLSEPRCADRRRTDGRS